MYEVGDVRRQHVVFANRALQLCYGDAVVFVYHRHDPVGEELAEGVPEIDVALPVAQNVLGRQQNLTDGHTMAPEKAFIDAHEQALSHCGRGLQLGDGAGNGFYLPTQRALSGGHYSAIIKSNWVGPEGGAMLVDESVGAINSLFEGAPYQRTR